MKLSLRSEYALLSLIHITRLTPGAAISLEALARSQQIPVEALAEIVAALARARYLRKTGDAYCLAKPAEKISVAEIIRLFDGALAPLEPVSVKGYQPAPMEREPRLANLFWRLQNEILDRLESTNLANLI